MPAFILTLPFTPPRPPPARHATPSMRVIVRPTRRPNIPDSAAALSQLAIDDPPSPADWLRANEAALRQGDESMLKGKPRRPASPPTSLVSSGLLNLAGGGRWLYSGPASYCAVDEDVEFRIESLEEKVFYLGPVTRNKVVRAVELVRGIAKGKEGRERMSENVTVALIVADLQMDCETVCAAVLNGFVGGGGCEEGVVEREVGVDVVRILRFHERVVESVKLCVDERFTEMSFSNLRELILVGAMDEHRAISLELARAVLKIRTLDMVEDERERICIARRTMFLYAPLANQLGIWYVQGELEELAFMYLQPESFYMVRQLVGERRRECESTLGKSKEFLERVLSTTPQVRSLVRTVLIKGRVKGLYSVYRKMRRSGKKIYEIYDLLALRVVVQPKRADEESEVAACYAVADVIKQHYETFESRAKDYIASPKRNGYRSLHLTVVPRGGSTPLEIQIRTEKMHHVAEFGAAAHWIYKEKADETDETDGDEGIVEMLEEEEEMGGENGEEEQGEETRTMYNNSCNSRLEREQTLATIQLGDDVCGVTKGCSNNSDEMAALRSGMVSKRRYKSGEDVHDQLRKGYVNCLASAIRTSRVIVAAAGQLYGLAVGSTLMDLAHGLGVASLGAIAVVNGSVAPLTQRLEMNDIVRFIQAIPEA